MVKPKISLFVDGSVNPQSQIGFGAYLLLEKEEFLSAGLEQNIIGLKDRRDGFEKNNYVTSKGTVIKNHELYKDFFT